MQRQLGVQQKSRRDDMPVENSTFAIKKSRRDDMSVARRGKQHVFVKDD